MESAAQTLLSNAGQLLSKEYQQLRGVGGEVAELRDDLDVLNALLIMQSEAEDGAVDRFVQVCMKQLRELAYDAEDCIDMYRLRIKSRPNDGVRAWLGRLLGTLSPRRRLACEISALRTRAVAISERQARFGVNRDALRRSSAQLPAHIPASSSTPANDTDRRHRLVGIADQANSLAARLTAPVGEEAEPKAVFSIVGFGGLGKTTLAMEVCRLLEGEFPCQAMVSVSQAFQPSRDLEALLKGVLQQVVKPKTGNETGIKQEGALGATDGLDDNGLAKKLEELVRDKRFLIVIDDVWTVRAWYAIQSKLPENNKGSRIIVTTRIETVAKACSPDSVTGHCIHKMEALKLEDFKKLFLSRVFDSVDDASYPKEFKDVMGDILKKCGGMPLAIISIASVLAGYKSPGSKAKWDTVCKSIGSQMESHPTLEGMRHIITLSYNHLPHELKCCVMSFSIFPEDYAIKKHRLLNRWIAEGLVHQNRGLTMWEVAESYLEELLSRNMIEEAGHFEGYAWNDQTYRVHDMLLEVMVSKSLEANFVSLQGGKYDGMLYDKIRRLSIHGDVDSVDYPSKRKATGRRGDYDLNVQHVRSLSIFHLQGHKLLNQLGNFTLLRVLDLEDCEGVTNKHVRYACNLYLLRFLSLRGTQVSKVPPQVENLEHLHTLDLAYTLLVGLPETVTKLEKLEHLWLCNMDKYWDTMWIIPQGLNKMKALRLLVKVCLGNDSQVARELGELEQLQKLDLSLDDSKTIIDEDVLKELGLSLSKMHSLGDLTIQCRSQGSKTLNFLHHLPTPPRLLRTLWMTGDMDELPSWIGSLTRLVSFTITRTTLNDDQLFGVLCKLPNLKTLYVAWDCDSDRDELVARTSHKFPMLRHLKLGGYLPKVLRFEEGSTAALETLELDFDFRSWDVAERSILGIEQLTNLKKITLDGDEDNPALSHAVLEQLKAESDRRSGSNQFQIVVKHIYK